MGINIGDVIESGADVCGGGVNIAARLQARCPPGEICISRPVRDHVGDRLGLRIEELGLLALKNIARPVEAFVVLLHQGSGRIDRPSGDVAGRTAPQPDRPSIAVLPFANMSADPDQEFFSDGIAEDIITELSRSRSLLVIARNSSFVYRGRNVDVRQIAQELGVRYVHEGSVRRIGDRVRVTAQLVDAETGNHLWAERYDRELSDIFEVTGRNYSVNRAGDPAGGGACRATSRDRSTARESRSMGGLPARPLASSKERRGGKPACP